MTDEQLLAAISVNLLRIAKWHAEDPANTLSICERHLQQSLQLAEKLQSQKAVKFVDKLKQLSLQNTSESTTRTAERFLTLGVILQHTPRA